MSTSEPFPTWLLRCIAAHLEGPKTMFNSVTRTFERIALPVFLMLAITPMLAVAVAASIH
jgi:hypothetical protein